MSIKDKSKRNGQVEQYTKAGFCILPKFLIPTSKQQVSIENTP